MISLKVFWHRAYSFLRREFRSFRLALVIIDAMALWQSAGMSSGFGASGRLRVLLPWLGAGCLLEEWVHDFHRLWAARVWWI